MNRCTGFSELIVKLEAAQEGSTELDAALHEAVTGETCHRVSKPPRYTRSLDDALTLVPEGWGAKVVVTPDKLGAAVVYEPRTGEEWDQNGLVRGAHGERRSLVEFARTFKHAATPALALCIACLRVIGTGRKP